MQYQTNDFVAKNLKDYFIKIGHTILELVIGYFTWELCLKIDQREIKFSTTLFNIFS